MAKTRNDTKKMCNPKMRSLKTHHLKAHHPETHPCTVRSPRIDGNARKSFRPDDSPSTDTWQSDDGSTIMVQHPEAESHEEHVELVSERLDKDNPPPSVAPPLRKPP